MAAIDFGVIAVKNHELYNLADLGTMGQAQIGQIKFYRQSVFAGDQPLHNFAYEFLCLGMPEPYVLKWDYQGINFKTKRINDSVFLTTFKFNNDFYTVLQGYDISLDRCYKKSTIKLIKKLMLRKTGKSIDIKKVK